MKLLIRLTAIILGSVVTTGGLSSCKKDSDPECCSWRYDGERYEYCEDDSLVERYLEEYDADWADFKDYVEDEYDANCS